MHALRNLIREVLSLPNGTVRPSRDNGAFTPGIVIVNDVSSESLGMRSDFVNGQEVISESIVTLISIHVFGKNANTLLNKFRLALRTSHFLSGIKQMHACVYRYSDVRDLTTGIGATKEERSQIDVYLMHNFSIQTDLPAIELTSIHAQAQTSKNNIITINNEVNQG
ncbi:hypothetical protein SAMN02583745_01581 [Thorsellia anophelis DSM 18579]|uniref:Phage neck terminator protein gp12-like domain-containing protein n=2 Tax=Thorsellia anophelis TaxID=336804 RepID=A0A1I0CCL2_9GAMM|nr:hypothetical protein SAMN02583745_01581 [Thorsellia anophelis DSM 18579]